MVTAVRRSFGTEATTSANMALGPNHTFCLRAEETAELCRAYPRRYRPSCSRGACGGFRRSRGQGPARALPLEPHLRLAFSFLPHYAIVSSWKREIPAAGC